MDEETAKARVWDFMEAHGDQVLTALRTTVEFWQDTATATSDTAARRLAEDQVMSWRAIYEEAQSVIDQEPVSMTRPGGTH